MNAQRSVLLREAPAVDGLRRRGLSVLDVERMVASGILREDERLELIDGNLVPMPAKGIRHEVVKRALLRHWMPLMAQGLEPLVETTLRLSDDAYVEPDLLLVPAAQPLNGLTAAGCLLAVEIADGSPAFDLDVKAPLYEAAGLPELWVIEARRLTAVVFSRRTGSWVRAGRRGSGHRLVPGQAPAAAVTLAQLELL
jgi:Uma2 family endonuclease